MTVMTRRLSAPAAGGYRPVREEVHIPGLPVRGALPPELDGTVLRIGPNPLGPVDPARHNVFEGDAMVHGLRIRDGRALWYRNRWLRTDRVCRQLGLIGTPGPRHGLSDNANGNLIQHAGRLLALGDGGVLPAELCPELETVARWDPHGALPHGIGAHPARDPVTGELLAVAYRPGVPELQCVTLAADGSVRASVTIPVTGTTLAHAFSVTERHAVVYDLPVTFSAAEAAAGSRVPYTWDERHGARLGLLPHGGSAADVRWAEVEPCYVFHPVNAYEAGDRVVLDVIRHERVFDRDRLRPSESTPTRWRWTVDPGTGAVAERQLDDHAQEFPRIDDRYQGLEYHCAFAVALDPRECGVLAGPALLRHDLRAGTTERHSFAPGQQSGEAVFVPRHADAEEGDGWLLSFVYDALEDRSSLVVLDTADFAGEPVAVVPLPVRVPHGFHACWIAAE